MINVKSLMKHFDEDDVVPIISVAITSQVLVLLLFGFFYDYFSDNLWRLWEYWLISLVLLSGFMIYRAATVKCDKCMHRSIQIPLNEKFLYDYSTYRKITRYTNKVIIHDEYRVKVSVFQKESKCCLCANIKISKYEEEEEIDEETIVEGDKLLELEDL